MSIIMTHCSLPGLEPVDLQPRPCGNGVRSMHHRARQTKFGCREKFELAVAQTRREEIQVYNRHVVADPYREVDASNV